MSTPENIRKIIKKYRLLRTASKMGYVYTTDWVEEARCLVKEGFMIEVESATEHFRFELKI